MTTQPVPVALVTGASRGLGRAVTATLVERGWRLIVDARDPVRLAETTAGHPSIQAVPGDVADPGHRRRLAEAVATAGRLDVLINNASVLGPSPQPRLADYPLGTLAEVYAVNTFAPLALLQLVLPWVRRVVNVSSDAAVEAYPGWGGYGSAKAALDHLTRVLAVEHPDLRVYSFDPGDMATDLQQQAFPGEDVGDRPAPETVVPALLRVLTGDLPSGRYRAADLLAPAPGGEDGPAAHPVPTPAAAEPRPAASA
jgi:NAD(P)-dependent dehydrogenase (short-subunit alcohol dehydrogenase family)